jgi:transcriptional regulator with XRE-family HTH domain
VTRRFGTIIRERREELNLSQGAVASKLKISSPEFIGMVEKGVRRLELNKVPLLAVALQLDSLDLCRIALHEAHPGFYTAIFGPKPPERPAKT